MKKIFSAIFLLALPLSAQGQLKRDFIKVKNFARQAAEKANGGLSNYRATSDMYDNTKLAPCEWKGTSFNAEKEERYVCVVMGGKPARIVKPTIKTVVAVTVRQSPWDIRVISNERTRMLSNNWKLISLGMIYMLVIWHL